MRAPMMPTHKEGRVMQRKLGLLGNGIGRSSAPRLHELAGSLAAINVTYTLIDLETQPTSTFATALAQCAAEGYWGVNVTYPFKEQVARLVTIPSPAVQQIGSVNTVVFGGQSAGTGHNTDYSGFLHAYRHCFPQETPGIVAVVGSGGVGRPVSFGLAALGAQELRLFDLDRTKALALAEAIQGSYPALALHVCNSLIEATEGADGLVNCTPLGMWQHPGNPIPAEYINYQRWAFDVIYTPLETEFLAAAKAKGLAIMSGYELFFYQGVDAFAHFTGIEVDEVALRAALGGR